MKPLDYLVVFMGLVLLAACESARAMPVNSNSDEVPLLSTPTPADVTDEAVTPPVADIPFPAGQKMAELSRENLSRILKSSIDQIITTEGASVIWLDISLGCPQAGIMYAQIMIPGFKIMLETRDRHFLSHG